MKVSLLMLLDTNKQTNESTEMRRRVYVLPRHK